jgi:hypothetical protein
MDKRDQVKQAILDQLLKDFIPGERLNVMVEGLTNATLKAIEEPEPRPSLLAVDKDTPDGTLCWFWDNNRSAGYANGLSHCESDNGYPFTCSRSVDWINAERFIGIHLLLNPGYQPCSGLVVIHGLDRDGFPWVDVRDASDSDNNWEGGLHGSYLIREFMPVVMRDGHLVADPERLR